MCPFMICPGLLVSLTYIALFIIGISQVSALSSNEDINNSELLVNTPAKNTSCISYEKEQKLIRVQCKSMHLTDIYKQINDPSILGIENRTEGTISSMDQANTWILDAGIVVEKEGGLIIDSSDTSWLKITSTPTLQLKQPNNVSDHNAPTQIAVTKQKHHYVTSEKNSNPEKIQDDVIIVSKHNGDNPNGIHVHGSLIIDGVRITSWDPEENDVVAFNHGKRTGEEHTKSDYDTAEPRAFIRVSKLATGTANITNSELAYLGYSCSRCAGLSYYGGDGSVIKNNNIHHLLKGFYSKSMGYMLIEDNEFHDNYLYGIDPHTGSHDMVIRNNIVYNNNASGIICSKHCYNLLIEDNKVYRNQGVGRGIAFSINTTNSIARNNEVFENERCISFNRESNYNQVYNNSISNCEVGIYLSNTSNNSIYGNKIVNSKKGIVIKDDVTNNVTNNLIDKSNTGIAFMSKHATNADPAGAHDARDVDIYLDSLASENVLVDISYPFLLTKDKFKGLDEFLAP